MSTDSHNPHALHFESFEYMHSRARVVRTHNSIYHRYEYTPSMALPVTLGGVVP